MVAINIMTVVLCYGNIQLMCEPHLLKWIKYEVLWLRYINVKYENLLNLEKI